MASQEADWDRGQERVGKQAYDTEYYPGNTYLSMKEDPEKKKKLLKAFRLGY